MNYFDDIPDEIILLIFSFIPDYFPIMYKLDRRWRKLLEDEYDYACNYAELILCDGYKYKLGAIDIYTILDYVECNALETMLYAEYTWNYEELDELYTISDVYNGLADFDHPLKIDEQRYFESLFVRILSRCARRDSNITRFIAMCGNVNVVKQAYTLGFTNDDSTLIGATNLPMMKMLHENGCSWPEEMLEEIIDSRTFEETSEYTDEWLEMFRYAVNNGAIITDEVVEAIVSHGEYEYIKILCKSGYIFTAGYLVNLEQADQVRYWMLKASRHKMRHKSLIASYQYQI